MDLTLRDIFLPTLFLVQNTLHTTFHLLELFLHGLGKIRPTLLLLLLEH
jgi:hypothetical protein